MNERACIRKGDFREASFLRAMKSKKRTRTSNPQHAHVSAHAVAVLVSPRRSDTGSIARVRQQLRRIVYLFCSLFFTRESCLHPSM